MLATGRAKLGMSSKLSSGERHHGSWLCPRCETDISYCLKDGYGTRLIPEGTIRGAHFVKVVNDKVSYVQVTGQGDVRRV